MNKTLYDMLELSQSAPPEAVSAAYGRIRERLSGPASEGDEEARNRMIALREAHLILSDPLRRKRYDQDLQQRSAVAETASSPESSSTAFRAVLVSLLVLALGLGYAKIRSDEEKARQMEERMALERQRLKVHAAERAFEERQASERAEAEQKRVEAQQRYERDRDLAYGNQVTRDLQNAERKLAQERQREQQAVAIAERQRVVEAERQLAREKAYLRQIENENRSYRR